MPLALKIVLLAMVQGFSEFFPVSSSGHLLVLQKLLNFTTMPLVYDIFFHLGTLLAVGVFFFKDLKALALRFYEKENFRLLLLLLTASLPTALIGFLFKDFFESLFEKTAQLGFCFLFTAAVLLASRFRICKRIPAFPAAFIIGVAQGLAIAPAISRSGMTIAVALILGLGFEFSFRFSFLLSIPAVLGAVLLEADKIPWTQGEHWPRLLLAVLAAALSGFLALWLLKKVMVREKFHLFGIYLLFLGVLVLSFL